MPSLHNRRGFLQVGACSAAGLTLPTLFANRAAAKLPTKGKSVILVNLTGGMSHLDTLDMKMDAPTEVRGEFQPISTRLPGVQVCEHLPMLAERMNKWALVRTMSHRENGHLPGTHRLLTGATMPNQRGSDLDNILSRNNWPCYAAGLNYLRPRNDGIPNGVTLPRALIEGPLTWPGQHAGFLKASHDPMLVTQDPNADAFKMDAFTPAKGTDSERINKRRSLLEQLATAPVGDPAFRGHQERAFELLTSGRVAGAFRLDHEAVATRDRYGRNLFGQSLLLARRLVQAGVPIIQANMGTVQTWDTHTDNWGKLKNQLLPWLDRALAALVDDLESEGLLQDTLVVAVGEFGRTPKVSFLPGEKTPGRDHWAGVYSGLFTGAGVCGGRVIGKSDKTGSFPVTDPYSPFDLGATIYRTLGIDPDSEILDATNRPSRINTGKPMDVLFENK